MKYEIGFKSGARLELDVADDKAFFVDVLNAFEKERQTQPPVYIGRGVLVSVKEIEFIKKVNASDNEEGTPHV